MELFLINSRALLLSSNWNNLLHVLRMFSEITRRLERDFLPWSVDHVLIDLFSFKHYWLILSRLLVVFIRFPLYNIKICYFLTRNWWFQLEVRTGRIFSARSGPSCKRPRPGPFGPLGPARWDRFWRDVSYFIIISH